jgi:hypothetical protein
MTVKEIMERTGSQQPGIIIALIRDFFKEIAVDFDDKAIIAYQNIVANTRKYTVPASAISVKSVACLDSTDGKYYTITPIVGDSAENINVET